MTARSNAIRAKRSGTDGPMKNTWITSQTVDEIARLGTLFRKMSGFAEWRPHNATHWSWESSVVIFQMGSNETPDVVVKRLVSGWQLVEQNRLYVEQRVSSTLNAIYPGRLVPADYRVTHVVFTLSTMEPGSVAVTAGVSVSFSDDVHVEIDLVDPDDRDIWHLEG